jgi:regulation of enolase protein 1 (concanavalin A-like superfamily)
MERTRVDWESGSWTREPAASRVDDGDLVVTAVGGSDWWRTTHYGFVHDDGHGLVCEWPTDAAVEVTFDASTLTGLYDQAGLLLWAGAEQWIKTGLEVSDGVLHVGAVVTNGVSDWSLAPVPEWAGRLVTIRASRGGEAGDAVTLRARSDAGGWRTLRVAPFTAGAASVGPMICAPMRADLEVRFTEWAFTAPDADLHEDPPIR